MRLRPVRAVIVDDEPSARGYLDELLGAHGVAVVGSCGTPDEAEQVIAGVSPDVLFVDIDLEGDGGALGLSWLRSRSQASGGPLLVMATAYDEYALRAFELRAIDYLVKPWAPSRVARCVDTLRRSLPASADAPPLRVVARRGKSLRFLALESILAFQSTDRLVMVHTEDGCFDADLSLATFEQALDERFLRTHRSWLVNLEKVIEATFDGAPEIRVESGAASLAVPVSQERARLVREGLLRNAVGLRR